MLCCIPFLFWHCKSVAPNNQALYLIMLYQVHQEDILCTWLSHCHLYFKTRLHSWIFTSTVLSGFKPCIIPMFNSDVFIIGVDNHASRCMDSNISQFTIKRLPKKSTFTKSIANRLVNEVFGMIYWNLQDNQDFSHHIAIHDVVWSHHFPHPATVAIHQNSSTGSKT